MEKEFVMNRRIDFILGNFDKNIPEGWTESFLENFSRGQRQIFFNNKKFLTKQNLKDNLKPELLKIW